MTPKETALGNIINRHADPLNQTGDFQNQAQYHGSWDQIPCSFKLYHPSYIFFSKEHPPP